VTLRIGVFVVLVTCEGPAGAAGVPGRFDGPDRARPQIPVALCPVLTGLSSPTDIQAVPGAPGKVVVLEKAGRARVWDTATGQPVDTLLDVEVLTRSEQGLLGLAFHPGFSDPGASGRGRFFVHRSVKDAAGRPVGRISEWRAAPRAGGWTVTGERVLLEVVQPYANHDGGQIAFGPDGHLYVGWGDGGAAGDPLGHGQNASTLLGAMIRISPDATNATPYGVPPDNPFVGRSGVAPEIWATGLRNPWRFTFAPDGRLIVADVGQNKWEEVDVVRAGDNLGWSKREGAHCFPPGSACSGAGLVDPVWEYAHGADGRSVTGGVVYTGDDLPALAGRYLVGDFVSGRIWALTLATGASTGAAQATALGRWDISISTFGRQHDGEALVADYARGVIYRLCPP